MCATKAGNNYSCLIVDDEEGIHFVLDQSLKFYFSNIFTAMNGAEALSIASRLKPDVIFSDYKMPGMNGLQLLNKLKDLLPDAIKVLFTAYGDKEVVKTALNEGLFGFLDKPIHEDELYKITEKCLAEIERRRSIKKISSEQSDSLIKTLSQQYNLSQKQMKISTLLKEGKEVKQISKDLNISAHTVMTHLRTIRKKMGLTNSKKNLKVVIQSL